MPAAPFLLRAGTDLVHLEPVPFPQELHLQDLLAKHPALLPGGDDVDRRWLLVTQELPVSSSSTTFFLDHLFLDSDGLPTLVECKLASNPEHRRAVIGQALDYASWFSIDKSDVFRRYAAVAHGDPDEAIRGAFGDGDEDYDVDAYWRRVDDMLTQRRMRIIFAGDRISPEVRRVVEFLNREMQNVEVLAVQYEVWEDGDGVRVLIPTVFGQTVEAEAVKSSASATRVWTDEEWLAELERINGASATRGLRRVIEAWRRHGDGRFVAVASAGQGNAPGFHLYLEAESKWAPALRARMGHWLVMPVDQLSTRTWIGDAAVKAYLDRLVFAGGAETESQPGKRLKLPASCLESETATDALIAAMNDWAAQLKAAW